jgi:hypothetical protein
MTKGKSITLIQTATRPVSSGFENSKNEKRADSEKNAEHQADHRRHDEKLHRIAKKRRKRPQRSLAEKNSPRSDGEDYRNSAARNPLSASVVGGTKPRVFPRQFRRFISSEGL